MSRGRRRAAWETLAWTSWRARSTSRDSSISTVMLHDPCRELEVSVRTPSTWMRASSRVSTTSFSMTSGAAPSQVAETLIVGKSTSGNWLMPIRAPGDEAEDDGGGHEHPGQDGFSDAGFGEVHGTGPYFFSAAAGAAAAAADPHRDAVREGLGAADDEGLAALEAGEDLDPAVGRPHPQGQDALDGLIAFDDVGEKAALARADRGDGDDGSFAGRGDRDRDLGERAGPEGAVAGVFDVGRDVDEARRVVGRLGHVDDLGREFALVLPDPEAGLLARLDPGGVALGDAEPEEERIAADERRQDGARLDVLAGLDGPRLDDPGDRAP